MAKSIQEILGGKNVQGVFEGIKAGFPTDLPASFYSVSRNVTGKSFKYHKTEGTRQTAKVNHYNAKSEADNPSGVDEVPVDCLYSSFHWDVDPVDLINIANPGSSDIQEMSTGEVMRRLAEMKQKQMNLRNTAVHMALMGGTLYADASGNLLSSSANALKLSVDFDIPSTNKDQLEDVGGSTIISASWGTAGTDITGQIRKIIQTSLKRTGYQVRYAVYGSNVPGYILGNTDAQNLMQSNVNLTRIAQTGTIPNPFCGLQWIPGDVFFWEDATGTTQSLVGDDEVIYLPEPNAQWYDLVQGSYPMADTIDVQGENMSGLRMARGMTVQSKLTDDPVSAQMIHRDCFLPVIKVPAAVYISDVTP